MIRSCNRSDCVNYREFADVASFSPNLKCAQCSEYHRPCLYSEMCDIDGHYKSDLQVEVEGYAGK